MIKHEIANTFNSTGAGFTTIFSSGTITVPDEPGGYIIATGCGSGKTSSIKDIIRQKYDDGILYVVDTVAEACKMYQYIVEVTCNETKLLETDVVLIVSPDGISDVTLKAKAQDMVDGYKSDPSVLSTKKVVIATHVRLWVDNIDMFFVYGKRVKKEKIFDGDFCKLMGRSDLRRYILIDETPLFFRPFFSMPRCMVGGFLDYHGNQWVPKDSELMLKYYDEFVSESSLDFANTCTRSGINKRDTCLELIKRNYVKWVAQQKEDMVHSFYYPNYLIQPGMKTHVLLYEGAGDVLFSGQSHNFFKVLTTMDKYKCTVMFDSFSYKLDRKKEFEDQQSELDSLVNNLTNIINQSTGKTLIVCPKDLGSKKQDSEVGSSRLVDYLKNKLQSSIQGSSIYDVIYFGSSQCKSTNDFRDFQNIVLCGKWSPSSIPIKQAYGFETEYEDYRMYFYIQLLSRIGIRNRDGKAYKVWYSEDYDDIDIISRLDRYFNTNMFTVSSAEPNSIDPNSLECRMKDACINKKSIIKDIKALSASDPFLQSCIEMGREYRKEIKLEDLCTVLNRKTRERRKFNPLIKALDRLSIELCLL